MGINKNFVVRNGLEVAEELLYADDNLNRVGINTAKPEFPLEVRGDSKLGGALINAGIAGTSGIVNQYLKSTGDGWEWESFPVARQVVRYSLTAGQTRVPATGNFPDFVLADQDNTSIYIDGVKQTVGDYSIDAGGASITLFAAAFGDEEIEIIAHGANTVGTGNTGITGITARKAGIASGTPSQITIFDFVGLGVTLDGKAGLVTVYIDSGGLSDVVSDPSPQLGGSLEVLGNDIFGTGNVNLTGVITATEFAGDGGNLTGITTLIKAGDFITLTTSGGITTITGQQGGTGGFFNDDQSIAGIHTVATVVGLGTTNPRFQAEIGAVGAAGTQLWVNGDARITGILTIGSSSITLDGDNDLVKVGTAVTIDNEGIDVTGVVTATSFDGDLTGQHRVYTAGVSNSDDYTIAMFLDPTQGGHTYNRYDLGQKLQYNPSTGQLSNVGIISATGQIISGVTTHQGEVNFQANINLGDNDEIQLGDGSDLRIYHTGALSRIDDVGDGGIEIRANPSVKIQKYTNEDMAVFNGDGSVELYYDTAKKFETTESGALVTGILTATSFVGDGAGLTGVTATGTGIGIRDDDSIVGTATTINFGSNLAVSAVSGGICTITGTDGGDADTLSGISSSSFLLSDAPDTKTSGDLTFDDSVRLQLGTGGDMELYHNGSTSYIKNATGALHIENQSDDGSIFIRTDNGQGGDTNYIDCSGITGEVRLYHYGSQKLATKSNGIDVTGHIETDTLNVGINSIETGSGIFTATAGVAYTANTYAVADFVNAEYTLFFQHSSGIQSQKVLVMDDGTTAYAQEYAIMSSNDLLVSVGATVKSGNVELEWTPETGVSGVVTYRYTRETMF